MPASQNVVQIVQPGQQSRPLLQANPSLDGPNSAYIAPTSPEGYRLYERLVDSDALYLNKLTRELYSAQLVKTNTIDPNSPLPGYRLVKMGGEQHAPNINFKGYTTVTNNLLIMMSEAISSTQFDPSFDIRAYAILETMSIIDMMVANRKQWAFTDHTLIRPVGFAIFKNLLAVAGRSSGGTLMKMMFHPAVFGSSPYPEEKKKREWLPL